MSSNKRNVQTPYGWDGLQQERAEGKTVLHDTYKHVCVESGYTELVLIYQRADNTLQAVVQQNDTVRLFWLYLDGGTDPEVFSVEEGRLITAESIKLIKQHQEWGSWDGDVDIPGVGHFRWLPDLEQPVQRQFRWLPDLEQPEQIEQASKVDIPTGEVDNRTENTPPGEDTNDLTETKPPGRKIPVMLWVYIAGLLAALFYTLIISILSFPDCSKMNPLYEAYYKYTDLVENADPTVLYTTNTPEGQQYREELIATLEDVYNLVEDYTFQLDEPEQGWTHERNYGLITYLDRLKSEEWSSISTGTIINEWHKMSAFAVDGVLSYNRCGLLTHEDRFVRVPPAPVI